MTAAKTRPTATAELSSKPKKSSGAAVRRAAAVVAASKSVEKAERAEKAARLTGRRRSTKAASKKGSAGADSKKDGRRVSTRRSRLFDPTAWASQRQAALDKAKLIQGSWAAQSERTFAEVPGLSSLADEPSSTREYRLAICEPIDFGKAIRSDWNDEGLLQEVSEASCSDEEEESDGESWTSSEPEEDAGSDEDDEMLEEVRPVGRNLLSEVRGLVKTFLGEEDEEDLVGPGPPMSAASRLIEETSSARFESMLRSDTERRDRYIRQSVTTTPKLAVEFTDPKPADISIGSTPSLLSSRSSGTSSSSYAGSSEASSPSTPPVRVTVALPPSPGLSAARVSAASSSSGSSLGAAAEKEPVRADGGRRRSLLTVQQAPGPAALGVRQQRSSIAGPAMGATAEGGQEGAGTDTDGRPRSGAAETQERRSSTGSASRPGWNRSVVVDRNALEEASLSAPRASAVTQKLKAKMAAEGRPLGQFRTRRSGCQNEELESHVGRPGWNNDVNVVAEAKTSGKLSTPLQPRFSPAPRTSKLPSMLASASSPRPPQPLPGGSALGASALAAAVLAQRRDSQSSHASSDDGWRDAAYEGQLLRDDQLSTCSSYAGDGRETEQQRASQLEALGYGKGDGFMELVAVAKPESCASSWPGGGGAERHGEHPERIGAESATQVRRRSQPPSYAAADWEAQRLAEDSCSESDDYSEGLEAASDDDDGAEDVDYDRERHMRLLGLDRDPSCHASGVRHCLPDDDELQTLAEEEDEEDEDSCRGSARQDDLVQVPWRASNDASLEAWQSNMRLRSPAKAGFSVPHFKATPRRSSSSVCSSPLTAAFHAAEGLL
eukprot:TRINITY_DN30902_c0_g1_i1.p1 TRINITY_DN30902_c0_g1~~TRINITY_DN30902_c0_g1_i1.p1  ORF type:complete len:850 (-),score=219.96 TRINITY_DN30902_c0_g1_i1:80-2587(-)